MHRHLLIALIALATVATTGCYDSKRLIEAARNKAIQTRLDEVDLGEFRTTLPRDHADSSAMEVVVDLFGTVPRYKIPVVQEVIDRDEYRMRQAVIIALRKTTANEIADPHLTTFRERLLTVVNAELGETQLESLGFREVRFIPL